MKRYFRVTAKAALFNKDISKVLVIDIGLYGWGLPGGHVDEDETPDEAMARELYEECGVSSDDLRHADFFMHSEGKLVLAYEGTTRDEIVKSPQKNREGIPKWLTKDEFVEIDIEPGYKKLVLEAWAS